MGFLVKVQERTWKFPETSAIDIQRGVDGKYYLYDLDSGMMSQGFDSKEDAYQAWKNDNINIKWK